MARIKYSFLRIADCLSIMYANLDGGVLRGCGIVILCTLDVLRWRIEKAMSSMSTIFDNHGGRCGKMGLG